MAVEERSSDPASVLGQRRPNERREVDRTIKFWQQHRLEDDSPPLLTKFDFSKMRSDWAHRFLICSDQDLENAAFIAYGVEFAKLLELPEQVTAIISLSRQLPDRYLPLFAEGCSNAMNKQVSAQFSGSFDHGFRVELFRAVFLPIRLHQSWSKWLIFGSFNYRMVLSIDRNGGVDIVAEN